MGLLLCWLSLVLLCSLGQAAQPAKGVFETCPACRLNAMPELKKFLAEAIMKREYGDQVQVKYIMGKTPSLLLYDEAGKLISETEVDPKLKYDALHDWLQGMGFKRQAPDPNGPLPSDLKIHSATEAAAAATPAGPPAPTPAEPTQAGQAGQQQQQQQRRRRRMRQRMAHRRPRSGGPANMY